MLARATMQDIRDYGDWAYSLALDPTRSGYPTYCDGIKTKAEFLTAAKQALMRETEELLLFRMDGAVEGWISLTWIPEDGYLQVDSFNIRRGTRRALEELLTLLERHYSGYTAHFGFPGENRDAICYLRSQGFRCIEHAWNHTFVFQNYRATADAEGIERITRQSFDRFCAVYRPDPDTYWDCSRIFETLEDWTILVKDQNGAPDSAIFLRGGGARCCEVYGAAFADGEFHERSFCELLSAALNACKRMGARYMTYLCGGEERKPCKNSDSDTSANTFCTQNLFDGARGTNAPDHSPRT